jgi:hypothetical protein
MSSISELLQQEAQPCTTQIIQPIVVQRIVNTHAHRGIIIFTYKLDMVA